MSSTYVGRSFCISGGTTDENGEPEDLFFTVEARLPSGALACRTHRGDPAQIDEGDLAGQLGDTITEVVRERRALAGTHVQGSQKGIRW